MAKKRDGFRLGIAVIVIVVLFVAVVIYIGSGWDREPKVPFVVLFPHTLNLPLLTEEADVIGFGQVIGRIVELEHVEARPPGDESGALMLYLKVKGVVNQRVGLRDDCRMVAEGPVLGGQGRLRVTNRGVSPNLIDPAKPIYGAAAGFAAAVEMLAAEIDEGNPQSLMSAIKLQLDAGEVSSLMAKLHRSMDDLNALTQSVATQMNPAEADALITKLGLILDNLNLATGHLREQFTPGREGMIHAKLHQALDLLNRGLSEAAILLAENRPNLRSTLASIEHMTATVDTGIAEPIARELDQADPESLLSEVHRSFERLNGSLADLNVVTDKSRKIIVLNEGRFNRLFANLAETSDHLKSVSKDLRRSPWRLLYRPSSEGMREANILDAARAFSEAAGRLDDSATQLRALLASHDGGFAANHPDLVSLRDQLMQTFEEFRAAEQSLWKQLGTP